LIQLSWGTIALSILTLLLGGGLAWLWGRRNGRARGAVTGATVDLITALSVELEQLKEQVRKLEVKIADQQGRINILQSELALANSEVIALQQLTKEQASRITELTLENKRLRGAMIRVMRKTGMLEWSEDQYGRGPAEGRSE
jgi:hypothetical protein